MFNRKQKGNTDDSRSALIITGAHFQLKEAYKILRTNTEFICEDRGHKKIVITSCGAYEGKTTVSLNLAISWAQAGKKILLIDTDLRKPRLHKCMKVINYPGVTNILTKTNTVSEAIQKAADFGFDFIPCGPIPPNPVELIGSSRMGEFIKSIEDKYDYIIFDSPPSGFLTDATVLSKHCDGVVMACRHAHTSYELFAATCMNIKNAGADIIGAVINMVDVKKINRYTYYYESRYYSRNYSKYFDKTIKE